MIVIAEWTGFKNVNVPALVACFTLVGLLALIGVHWLRKPETRRKGIWVLSLIVIPTALAAIPLLIRLIV